MSGEDYVILREDDCIGVMPRSGAEADDIPDLAPILDRVLIKVCETKTIQTSKFMRFGG